MTPPHQTANGTSRQNPRLRDVLTAARQEFGSLTGRTVESTSAAHKTGEDWVLQFEVVELERVPDSTSVLGSYRVVVDHAGAVQEYEQTRRYHRNQASEAES